MCMHVHAHVNNNRNGRFKSHHNKQVQENYEMPVAKRKKDSTVFFTKNIIPQNANGSSQQEQN